MKTWPEVPHAGRHEMVKIKAELERQTIDLTMLLYEKKAVTNCHSAESQDELDAMREEIERRVAEYRAVLEKESRR